MNLEIDKLHAETYFLQQALKETEAQRLAAIQDMQQAQLDVER